VETIPPPAQRKTNSQNWANRIGWVILILATLYVCYFRNLGAIGFVGPDEPRYAWIARDMAETGDWVTPRLYGKPWFEKPPLYYWGAALCFKLFGVGEVAARLPSAVCALLATLAIAWLALRLYGAETARWLLLLLPTTVGMIGFSHAAATDMPFSAMLTIAMVAAAVLLGLVPRSTMAPTSASGISSLTSLTSFTSSTSFVSCLFGLFLGLAVLAKGPAAIILCGGAVLFWALVTKRWRDALRLFHPAGIAGFCLTALPWYILCTLHNPDFFHIFFIEHNFKRFLTPEFQHIQPFWFYGEVILIAFLPWISIFSWALLIGLKRLFARRLNPVTYFLLCWSAFCVVFFTISQSKLPGYILPAIPPIGLTLARGSASLASTRHRSFGLASLAAAVPFACAIVPAIRGDERLLRKLVTFFFLFGLVLFLFALANLLLGALSLFSRRSAALIAAVVPTLIVLFLLDEILPLTPVSILSPRYIAYQIQAEQIPLSNLRVSKLGRTTIYSLNFYLRTDLQEWDRDPSREAYVLSDGAESCSRSPQGMTCSDLWGGIDSTSNFELLHLNPKR
jgi:4-amino-4-deoxy-L-arabinose transferase-like glycosyltransferase